MFNAVEDHFLCKINRIALEVRADVAGMDVEFCYVSRQPNTTLFG